MRLFKRWKVLAVSYRHENWVLDRSPLIWGPSVSPVACLQDAQFPISQPCVSSIRHNCLRTDIAVPWDNCILSELSVLCKHLCRDGGVCSSINKIISANNCFCIRIMDLTSGRRCTKKRVLRFINFFLSNSTIGAECGLPILFSYRKPVHLQMDVWASSQSSMPGLWLESVEDILIFHVHACVGGSVHSQGNMTRVQKAGFSPEVHAVVWFLYGICPTLGTENIGGGSFASIPLYSPDGL